MFGTARIRGYTARIRHELRRTFAEEHTPHEVAGSFAFGTFVTVLPTLGVGLLLFAVVSYVSDRVSKVALIASALVFNPLVKWGVYVASFALGVLILGPVEGVTLTEVSLAAGAPIAKRVLVGNVILAAVATVVGYAVVHRLTVAYRTTTVGEIVEEAVEEIVDEVVEEDE